MARAFGRRSASSEDGSGWIYADLFLALTVVGLGSAVVTSVASSAPPAPPAAAEVSTTVATTTTVPVTTTTAPQPVFQLSCVEFAIPLPADPTSDAGRAAIEAAVASEIAARQWEADSARPGMVLVMGGYNSAEGATAGDVRARSLAPKLRESVPMFADVEMRTLGARVVNVQGVPVTVGSAGDYILVVYLLHTGEPLVENCSE
jgi:hypothetical protein